MNRRKRSRSWIILWVILLVFVVLQFFRKGDSTAVPDPGHDFLTLHPATDEVSGMLRSACYDCHSAYTTHPWYARIAPVSWLISSHIKEGRSHLNFSEWGTYTVKERHQLLDECAEEVQRGSMPLKGYAMMHSSARLDEHQRGLLIGWFRNARPEVAEEHDGSGLRTEAGEDHDKDEPVKE